MIRVVVVDDEPLARETIRDLLGRDADVEVVAECATGADAVDVVAETRPDVLFLDVQMPGLDGFEVLSRVVEHHVPVVVFVTAYDRYAVRAFDARAVDYLLKPFDDDRFAEALKRAKKAVESRDLEGRAERLLALVDAPRGPSEARPPRYPARLMVRSGSRLLFVRPEQIDWIEAEDYYSRVHVAGASYLLRASMAELEARLDPDEFARVHRSAIVNLDRVTEIHPDAKGQEVVRLVDGTLVPISRGRRAALERAFRPESARGAARAPGGE